MAVNLECSRTFSMTLIGNMCGVAMMQSFGRKETTSSNHERALYKQHTLEIFDFEISVRLYMYRSECM